jgi:hypothetical protein
VSEKVKATPGTWEVCYVHGVPIGIGVRQECDHGILFRMIGNTVEERHMDSDIPEIEANARLIASAPALLAACKAATIALRRAAEELGGTGYFERCADDVQAVINAAEGGGA